MKNYTAHPHDMVHVPAKFRENTSMRFWVTVRKLNVTDGQTGALQYLPSRAFGTAGDKNNGFNPYHAMPELICQQGNSIWSEIPRRLIERPR